MKTSMPNTPVSGHVPMPPMNCVGPAQNCQPPDAQSDEKLAIYVYEYLVHAGFQSTAKSFIDERFKDKTIRVGNAPGFLRSWWSVFWDLYCAAPELRDGDLQSSVEARAFYDYGMVSSGYPAATGTPGPMPGGPGGVPPGPDNMPPHHPSPMMSGGPFPFLHGGPGGPPMRPGGGPGQPMMPNRFPIRGGMTRPMQAQDMSGVPHSQMFPPEGIPPNMRFTGGVPGPGGPGHPRMQLIGGPGVPHPGLPPSSVAGLPPHHPGPGCPPGEPFRNWQGNTCLSPGMGAMSNGPPPPASATPIMPSPQSNAGVHPGSVGTPGPASVPSTCAPVGSTAGPMPSGGDQNPGGVMSPDYLSNPFPPGAVPPGVGPSGVPQGEDMDSVEIMRMKETLVEEAKSFENSDVMGSGTPNVTSDYTFMS